MADLCDSGLGKKSKKEDCWGGAREAKETVAKRSNRGGKVNSNGCSRGFLSIGPL